MRKLWFSVFGLLSIVMAGCGALQVNTEDPPTLPPSTPNENGPLSTPSPGIPKQEDDMPKDPPLPIPTNPGLRALTESAKADLAQRLSVPASQIEFKESKEAFWPDPSLGCPQPGILYAQIPTPGYIIILVHSGNEFEYHIDVHGNIHHCENPMPPGVGTPSEP